MKPVIAREKTTFFKDKRKSTMLIGLFIIGTMILGTIGYSFYGFNATDQYSYNDYKFIVVDEGWLTYINNNPVIFNFLPKDLEHINSVNIDNLAYNSKLYLTFNPEHNLTYSIQEFKRLINFPVPVIIACTEDVPGCEDLPLKTCNDATSQIGIIEFIGFNETKISLSNNCLKIEGNEATTLMIVNRLAYQRFGIMK